MMRGFEMGSLFGCSLEADPSQWEAKQRNGLVRVGRHFQKGVEEDSGPRLLDHRDEDRGRPQRAGVPDEGEEPVGQRAGVERAVVGQLVRVAQCAG